MKTKGVLLITITLAMVVTGCVLNKEVIIAPKELKESYSKEKIFKCETNLWIYIYKKGYRIGNKKDGDSFSLNKDGKILSVYEKNLEGRYKRIINRKLIKEKTSRIRLLFQEDLDYFKNEANGYDIGNLMFLDSSVMSVLLAKPFYYDYYYPRQVFGNLTMSLLSDTLILFIYDNEEEATMLTVDDNGKLVEFLINEFRSSRNELIDSLAKKMPEKKYDYFSVKNMKFLYLDKNREFALKYLCEVDKEKIKELREEILITEKRIKIDIINSLK